MQLKSKICSKCNEDQPLSSYHKNKDSPDGHQSVCKECKKHYRKHYYHREVDKWTTQSKEWYENNKERKSLTSKKKHVNSYFGITVEEYDAYFKDACCGICDATERLVLDHCHNTGVIRGVLCNTCNSGIGMLKDNPELLKKGIEWLTK